MVFNLTLTATIENSGMLKSKIHWVSPQIEKKSLKFPLKFDDKIYIFEDRVLGWQLVIAEQLYYGAVDKVGNPIPHGIEHNGFAVLYILLSYFEMIPKFEAGDLSEVSGEWFKKGITAVFPEIKGHTEETAILSGMWKGARNGLYHSAMTKSKVFIDGDAACIDFDMANKRLIINPGVVAKRTIAHFTNYIARLRDPKNVKLRANFEKKFDREILKQIQ